MNNQHLTLYCPKCGAEYIASVKLSKCPKCGEPLLVRNKRHPFSIIQHERIYLGEGNTPVVQKKNIFFKLEYLNPSGSFKDRGAALAVSIASQEGVEKIVEDSSGNAGLSYSLYGKAARIRVKVYVPMDIPSGKYRLMKALGAEVIKQGNRDEAHIAALSDKDGVYVGHTIQPFFLEGIKSIAWEAVEEIGNDRLKEISFLIPVASGTLFLGIYKGFKDLMEQGVIDVFPRFIAVQACGYSYLTRYPGIRIRNISCHTPTKFGDALRITVGERSGQIYNALIESHGEVMVIGDEPAIKAYRELLSQGFIVEPSSAFAYAAAKELLKENEVTEVYIPLTGSGLKILPTELEIVNLLIENLPRD